ncbi:MAG: hypothetical protein U1D70_09540 [Methylobacter sp.]|nr:hypothetical protein [Methylobacter sp.]MDP2428958.1 hypothetical protein [Methylobacter sp.]MDP3055242.1 hypothetical protein [Methylobacter sp.]MDP3361270.1 hypothetical protein [Methylobacter sp.]MDZ4219245.1 hypothetical protein [Methylobacter sp.]
MKKKIPVKSKLENADSASVAAQALAKQEAGQYKEAIELYKQLLKQSDNKNWQQALAFCYYQRALSFVDKGMFKEAVVLWENYAQNAQPPYQGYDSYISWLLQTNNMVKVKSCLSQLSAQQLDELYPDLASLLGLLIISEKPEFEALLPKESVFITHLGLVRSALAAYQKISHVPIIEQVKAAFGAHQHDQMEDIEQALKQLPFRSAFRDFRTLLKAALILPKSPEQAQALLAKIPASSPYQQAAALLLATTYSGAALVNELLQYDYKQRHIVVDIKKFSKKQAELLELLAKQKGHLSDKIKFNCAIQYRELFGLESTKAYCALGLVKYEAGQRDFTKHFGVLDGFEPLRLQALNCEQQRDYYGAEYYWKQAIPLLKKQGEPGAFKIALIMRHIAKYQETPKKGMQWLIDSLNYDPTDRDVYLSILQHCDNEGGQTDVHKHWLEQGLKKFPQDIDFLTLAIKAATASKAFKKATQSAQAILAIDPVNTFAKQVLFTSHLAHARKLIKTKKFHLVDKEIQQAEKLLIGKRYQIQAQLVRGFFVMQAEDKQQGLQQIVSSAQSMGEGTVCTHFCVIMEALLLGLTLPSIIKELPPLEKKHLLTAQEISRLVQLILQYQGDAQSSQAILHKALEKIKSALKQSVKQQNYAEELMLTLCECLDSIGHFELLRHCVKIALPKWPKPIWVFYKIYAEVDGEAEQCSSFNIYQLEEQFKKTNQSDQSDHRAAMLISKFINSAYQAQQAFGGGFFDDEYEDEDEDDFDMYDKSPMDLFGHLPADLIEKLQRRIEDFMGKNSPEKSMKILGKLLPPNVDAINLFLNPNALFGILMLHAANELGIDIGLTAEKILKECGFEPSAKTPPFPFF